MKGGEPLTLSVRIRLHRIGSKKNPHYRIVAIHSTRSQKANPIEYLGHYDPRLKDKPVTVKMDRLNYWISCGAKTSERIDTILKTIKENTAVVAESK